MSTKKTSTSTTAFNQPSLNAFNAMQPQVQALLQQYMSNPLAAVNPIYNLSGQLAQRNAARLGQSAMSNLSNNMAASGFGGVNMPAFMQSQIAAQNRATSGLQANAFLQNQLAKNQAALGVQQFGLGGAQSYRPLVTGGTNVESQSGLGSWLPQVLGAGLGIAGMAFGKPPGGPGSALPWMPGYQNTAQSINLPRPQ